MIRISYLILIIAFSYSMQAKASPACVGRLTNPITDICWKCLFPIHIAGVKVSGSSSPDRGQSLGRQPICFCTKPPAHVPMPGIPIGFWEPVRLVDVTKSPMCMVSLGGMSLGTSPTRGMKDDIGGDSFYHVHWYIYPVIYWLELLTDFLCLDMVSVDVAYLTEFDPFWNDDTKSTILNPEAILFGNAGAQAACIADAAAATAHLPLDALFWCAGAQGSIYPYTGTVSSSYGAVQASTLLVSRFIAKLHRELLLWASWGKPMLTARCRKYPMPILQKSGYKYQMTYPVAETHSCKYIGQSQFLWQAGREFPVKGEDFAYLIWHKRECCLGAL